VWAEAAGDAAGDDAGAAVLRFVPDSDLEQATNEIAITNEHIRRIDLNI